MRLEIRKIREDIRAHMKIWRRRESGEWRIATRLELGWWVRWEERRGRKKRLLKIHGDRFWDEQNWRWVKRMKASNGGVSRRRERGEMQLEIQMQMQM
jgi:hypothetical protein